MESVPAELTLASALLTALGAVVYFSWSNSNNPDTGSSKSISSSGGGDARRGKGNLKRGKRKRATDVPTFITSNDEAEGESNAESSSVNASKPKPKSLTTLQRSETLTVPGGLVPLISASEAEHSAAESSTSKSKKKKKGKKSNDRGDTPTSSMTLPPNAASASTSTASKNKKQAHRQEVSGASELDSESGWTQVTRGRNTANAGETASDTGMTTSQTEEEGSVASKKEETLTSAEKILPKAPKTAVDDMVDGPKPGIARVMRIPGPQPAQASNTFKPPAGYSLDDYEDSEDVREPGLDADEEDTNWNIVSWKKRGTNISSAYASDAVQSTSATLSATSHSAPTKKQRQNAARREAEKAAKAKAEQERRAVFAKHKKEADQAKIDAYYSGKGKSGGMTNKVDAAGNSVWD